MNQCFQVAPIMENWKNAVCSAIATHAKCRHLAKEESNYSIIPHFIDGLTQSGESVLHTETLTWNWQIDEEPCSRLSSHRIWWSLWKPSCPCWSSYRQHSAHHSCVSVTSEWRTWGLAQAPTVHILSLRIKIYRLCFSDHKYHESSFTCLVQLSSSWTSDQKM